MVSRSNERGFALPTVVLASLIVLITLSAGLTGASSTRVALDEQYHAQLTREASEAGVAKANACIDQYGSAKWSELGRLLTPESDCFGAPVIGVACPSHPSCYVVKNGNIQTSFSIGTVQTGAYEKLTYSADAKLEFTKTSDSTSVWKTQAANSNFTSVYSAAPKISGGAGYDINEHIALFSSSDKQLWGFGHNGYYQLQSNNVPSFMAKPIKMELPTGVTSLTKFATSGQGSSYICVIGDNLKAYCRGGGFATLSTGWSQIQYDGGLNLNAYDITVNGFGDDSVCVLAGTSPATKQVYCGGNNDYGRLGINSTVDLPFSTGAPFKKFVLPTTPVVLTAVKMFTQNNSTCVIASDENLYCAGANYSGQIPGSVLDEVYLPVKYALPNMGTVSRKVKDVLPAYHQDESTIFVLATDGTIWMSGERKYGMTGNGNDIGDTYPDPDLWAQDSATGGLIRTVADSTFCIDNDGDDPTDENWIIFYLCTNGNDSQEWFYTDVTKAIFNPKTRKCLDLPSGSVVPDGNKIQLYTCNGSPAQQWNYDAVAKTFRSAVNTTKCLDVPGGVPSGNRLQLWTCNGTPPQKFTVSPEFHPWKGMIAQNHSFCGIRPGDGTGVWCTGQNDFGQLADGGTCSDATLARRVSLPAGRTIDMSKLSSEWQSQFGSLQIITDDGQVYGAGANTYGKLGNGTMSAAQCQTVKFILPAGVKAVDMSTRDEYSTYVLGDDGRLYGAGLNNLGQLGDGTQTNRSTPVTAKIPKKGFAY